MYLDLTESEWQQSNSLQLIMSAYTGEYWPKYGLIVARPIRNQGLILLRKQKINFDISLNSHILIFHIIIKGHAMHPPYSSITVNYYCRRRFPACALIYTLADPSLFCSFERSWVLTGRAVYHISGS